jgi:hypothetical protein
MLKNFLAFSSSSQLLAGDHIIVGFDVIDVTIDVGVLGLISYDGDEGGDLRELFSKLLRCNGDGVRLVHKSKGISSIGFFGIERHVPFPAIEDIILDNMKGERWFVRALDSWLTLPVDMVDGCSEISF